MERKISKSIDGSINRTFLKFDGEIHKTQGALMLLASGYIRNLDLIPPGSFGSWKGCVRCETLTRLCIWKRRTRLRCFCEIHPQQSTINPVMLIFHDFHDDDEKGLARHMRRCNAPAVSAAPDSANDDRARSLAHRCRTICNWSCSSFIQKPYACSSL